jgi:predicted  nucleic acid-binding Zn-ribbon protein
MATPFDALLVVQEHDTASDRLRHRLATLPERAELDKAEQALAELDATRAEVGGRRDEIAARQKRLEDELASLEAKIGEVEKRLYSGGVTVPRELQALQADAESLKRHKSSLEDTILETMSEREPFDGEVDQLNARRAELEAEHGRLLAVLAEAGADIEHELATETAARAEAARDVPDDLLTRYEQLRAKLGGVGAARLGGASCTGCHLTLPATELDRIRRAPPDEVILCDQCGRILVRG